MSAVRTRAAPFALTISLNLSAAQALVGSIGRVHLSVFDNNHLHAALRALRPDIIFHEISKIQNYSSAITGRYAMRQIFDIGHSDTQYCQGERVSRCDPIHDD